MEASGTKFKANKAGQVRCGCAGTDQQPAVKLHVLAVCLVYSAGAILASGAGTCVQLKDCELEANIAKTLVCAPELG